jgi:hypothetical protein
MPEATQVLEHLRRVANEAVWLAVVWHAVVLIGLAFAKAGWRPPRRVAALLFAAPLASVSALAWSYENPFNGAVFAAMTALLVVVGLRTPHGPVELGPPWARWLGGAMILFAWVYPHFLEAVHPQNYLYASPMGLIPCPSLSLVVGLSLLTGALGSRIWGALVALFGLAYGLMGVFWLGVQLDYGLLFGSLALALGTAVFPRQQPHLGPAAHASAARA